MNKPYDSTLKEMVERRPRPWISLWLGRPIGGVQVINADLSTITAEADKLFRIEGPEPWIVHSEFETIYKSDAPLKGLRYNVLARCRHGLPVQTVFVLLRPAADGAAMTGTLEDELPDGTKHLVFRYHVVRVWELPAAQILEGDIATLPLAPITQVAEQELPSVIRRMDERIERETTPGEGDELRAAAFILTGLRYPKDVVRKLFQGVHRMKESSTYQAILEEGREEGRGEGMIQGARQTLYRQGRKRFGTPSPAAIAARIDLINDFDRLEALADRLLDVSSWEDLLSDP